MGFRSQDILQAHFSKFGDLRRVLVTHSKVKPSRGVASQARIRPGSLGFIVMGDAWSVTQILSNGNVQSVGGWQVRVEPFEHSHQCGQAIEQRAEGDFTGADFALSAPASGFVADTEEQTPLGLSQESRLHELAASLSKVVSALRESQQEVAFMDQAEKEQGQMGRSEMPNLEARGLPTSSDRLPTAAVLGLSPAPGLGPSPAEDYAKITEVLQQVAMYTMQHNALQNQIRSRQAAMSAEAVSYDQQTFLSRMACEQMQKCLEEQRQQMQQLRQREHMQQMHQQLHDLGPKLQHMQQMINATASAAAVAASQMSMPVMSSPSSGSFGWPMLEPSANLEQTWQSAASAIASAMPLAGAEEKLAEASSGNRMVKSASHGHHQGRHKIQEKPPSSARDQKLTLGVHLTHLQGEDPKCVFIARRITGLGFQSQDLLASHFSQFGKVTKVLVAHSKVKPFRRPGVKSRTRPGSLGFIVMEDAEAVEKILSAASQQTVAGCQISVEPFEQIAKPREGAASTAGDSTTTAGESTTPGSSGSNGSEEGSDKGNGSSGDNCLSKAEGSQGSSADSNGGDSHSESSNRAMSPTTETTEFADGREGERR